MASQGIAPRTAEYTRQRTRAIRQELTLHYLQPSQDALLSRAENKRAYRLHIYQNTCGAVHLPAYAMKRACLEALRSVLVTIVDYIDAARIGQPVKVQSDFAAFKHYTRKDRTKRMDPREAKVDGRFLAALL